MKILAIDGNSIMNRAFYGIKMLSNSKGFFTNAITGFLNIYIKEAQEVQPDAVAVAFDLKAPTFRHKAVASYKANRKGMPPELAQQMPVIKQILTAMGITVIECEGFEADDILGTLSELSNAHNDECCIVTGDRDSLQLVSKSTTVRLATNKGTVIYDEAKIFEVYGLEPWQLIEIKGLQGDTSDNISGVPGIGEKTALSLIQEHGSIEKLYENIETAKLTPSVRAKLTAGKDLAIESRWLGTIVKNAPINGDISSYKLKACDNEKLYEILSDMEMFKLREKLTGNTTAPAEAEVKVKKSELNKFEIKELAEKDIERFEKTAFVYENGHLEVADKDSIYLSDDKDVILLYLTSDTKKVCFSAKEAHKLCFANGREALGVTFCCDLAGYLLNSQSSDYSCENLCSCYKVYYRSDVENHADIASLSSLCDRLASEIEITEMGYLLYEVEQPLCEVLASMETEGVKIDIDGVRSFGETLKSDIGVLENEIYLLAGKEFNISSPKQLGVILFEDLGLPCKKKTKSGYSTNAEVLESLADKHPIIPKILEYRTLTKLNSTYVDGLLKVVCDDGRVRSVFKQTETRTGRISSTEPNVQNIPVRREIGRNMRKFFIADDGKVFLDADYSQIELRVLASVCGDENMQNIFLSGGDIHASTASQVFDLPLDFVTPEMRRAAKAVNFGIIYGIGAFSLSKDIGVSVAEAKKFIAGYLASFPKVSKYMEKAVEDGIKNGYVTTVFGRRRYIPELSSSNKVLQAFGKRAAMNAPIQGAAADIIKIAMVKVYRRLKAEKLDAKLILQVHDELIIEASEKDADRAALVLAEEMNGAVSLKVPIPADVNIGKSWYDAKD